MTLPTKFTLHLDQNHFKDIMHPLPQKFGEARRLSSILETKTKIFNPPEVTGSSDSSAFLSLHHSREEQKSDLFETNSGNNPCSSIVKNEASDISIGGLSPLLEENNMTHKANEEAKTLISRGAIHNFPVKQRKNQDFKRSKKDAEENKRGIKPCHFQEYIQSQKTLIESKLKGLCEVNNHNFVITEHSQDQNSSYPKKTLQSSFQYIISPNILKPEPQKHEIQQQQPKQNAKISAFSLGDSFNSSNQSQNAQINQIIQGNINANGHYNANTNEKSHNNKNTAPLIYLYSNPYVSPKNNVKQNTRVLSPAQTIEKVKLHEEDDSKHTQFNNFVTESTQVNTMTSFQAHENMQYTFTQKKQSQNAPNIFSHTLTRNNSILKLVKNDEETKKPNVLIKKVSHQNILKEKQSFNNYSNILGSGIPHNFVSVPCNPNPSSNVGCKPQSIFDQIIQKNKVIFGKVEKPSRKSFKSSIFSVNSKQGSKKTDFGLISNTIYKNITKILPKPLIA